MKKQLKNTVLALALLASATAVFAGDIANSMSTKKLVNYEWQQFDRNGNLIGTTTTTSSSNPYPTVCTGSLQLCARGRVQGTIPYTVFYRYPAL